MCWKWLIQLKCSYGKSKITESDLHVIKLMVLIYVQIMVYIRGLICVQLHNYKESLTDDQQSASSDTTWLKLWNLYFSILYWIMWECPGHPYLLRPTQWMNDTCQKNETEILKLGNCFGLYLRLISGTLCFSHGGSQSYCYHAGVVKMRRLEIEWSTLVAKIHLRKSSQGLAWSSKQMIPVILTTLVLLMRLRRKPDCIGSSL